MLSAGHTMSECWEDGSFAFPRGSVHPELAHQKPGKGANARDSLTTLLTLYVFFLMIKYFCYYEFTEEIQNLICRGVGLYCSEIQELKHIRQGEQKLGEMIIILCRKPLAKKIKAENNERGS